MIKLKTLLNEVRINNPSKPIRFIISHYYEDAGMITGKVYYNNILISKLANIYTDISILYTDIRSTARKELNDSDIAYINKIFTKSEEYNTYRISIKNIKIENPQNIKINNI
jgi:hypothetical protein